MNDFYGNPYMMQYMMGQMAQNPNMQQQMQRLQQMQNMQQPRTESITVALVPTLEHVEQVQMAPGERKIVLVQNNPNFLAIRVANAAGFVTTEYRESRVINPKAQAEQKTQEPYATAAEVETMRGELKQLRAMLEGKSNGKSTA